MNEKQESNRMAAEEDPQAIAELFKAWCATFNAQDLGELRSYYPSDAVMMPPNVPSIHGPENIVEEWFRPLLAAYRAEISLAPDEIRSEREWGFARGTYVVRVAPKAGGEFTEERGSFLDIVQRDRDGRWKIARAIWHSDTQQSGSGTGAGPRVNTPSSMRLSAWFEDACGSWPPRWRVSRIRSTGRLSSESSKSTAA